MQFSYLASVLSVAFALVSAQERENTVTFVSLDHIDRTMYFASNPHSEELDPVQVPGGQNVTVVMPHGWGGNTFAVADGSPIVPGMLAEFCFNAWNGINFFDVSAIVDPTDINGVKQIWPAHGDGPTSGCHDYSQPCDNVYEEWDDLQTQGTTECDFICTLGGTVDAQESQILARSYPSDPSSPKFAHDWVVGKWSAKARAR